MIISVLYTYLVDKLWAGLSLGGVHICKAILWPGGRGGLRTHQGQQDRHQAEPVEKAKPNRHGHHLEDEQEDVALQST